MALLMFQFYRSQFSKALEHALSIKGDPKVLWRGLVQSNSTLPSEKHSVTERGEKIKPLVFWYYRLENLDLKKKKKKPWGGEKKLESSNYNSKCRHFPSSLKERHHLCWQWPGFCFDRQLCVSCASSLRCALLVFSQLLHPPNHPQHSFFASSPRICVSWLPQPRATAKNRAQSRLKRSGKRRKVIKGKLMAQQSLLGALLKWALIPAISITACLGKPWWFPCCCCSWGKIQVKNPLELGCLLGVHSLGRVPDISPGVTP